MVFSNWASLSLSRLNCCSLLHTWPVPLYTYSSVWASRLTSNFKVRQFTTTTIRTALFCSFFTCDILRVLSICSPVRLHRSALWPFFAIAQARNTSGTTPRSLWSQGRMRDNISRDIFTINRPVHGSYRVHVSLKYSERSFASICVLSMWPARRGGCQVLISI